MHYTIRNTCTIEHKLLYYDYTLTKLYDMILQNNNDEKIKVLIFSTVLLVSYSFLTHE